MQYLLLIYTDDTLLQALPEGEADSMMRHCFAEPFGRISSWGGTPLSGVPICAPWARRICALRAAMSRAGDGRRSFMNWVCIRSCSEDHAGDYLTSVAMTLTVMQYISN